MRTLRATTLRKGDEAWEELVDLAPAQGIREEVTLGLRLREYAK